MKTVYSFLFLVLIPLMNFGQDSIPNISKKIQFSIQIGAHYKTFIDSKYIEPKPYNSGDGFIEHQYERFNKVPTFGYNAGLLLSFQLSKHWGITSGILYFLRNDIFENNLDTVIKYGRNSTTRDIRNAFKYDYSHNNIELPIMLKYSVKKVTFHTGCNVSLISYKKATYSYVVNQFPNNPEWITSNKTIAEFEMPFKIFPTFQASYDMKIKNVKLNPYVACYYELKNQNDFYIQIGIIFPLNKTP